MKNFRLIYLVLLVGFMFSCATNNVLHIRPIEQESIVDDGKEIVKKESDGVKIVASYDGRFNKYMIYDVEVFNNTDRPITVSPKNFTFWPLNQNRQNLHSQDGNFINSYSGIEPSEQINNIQNEMWCLAYGKSSRDCGAGGTS